MTDVRQSARTSAQLFAAGATVLGGLLMVAFSFGPWMRLSVRGADVATTDSVMLDGWGGTLPGGGEYGASRPAAWTVGLGVLLLLTGLFMVLRRSTVVAGISLVVAVIAVVTASVFLANPEASFGFNALADHSQLYVSTEACLWGVFFGALTAGVGSLSVLWPGVTVQGPLTRAGV